MFRGLLSGLLTVIIVVCLTSGLSSLSHAAEQNVDRPGGDIGRGFAADRWQVCEAACERNDRCRAWTWVRADSLCYLKNRIPGQRRSRCCVSGVKVAPGSEDNCRRYAQNMVFQQQRNLELGCGFRDQHWHARENDHYEFCRSTVWATVQHIQATGISATMRCERRVAGPQTRRYDRPVHPIKDSRGVSLRYDWCYTLGSGCGRKAADAFCRLKGFRTARDFAKENDIGQITFPTKTRTGKLCAAAWCDGFRFIECQR